MAVQKNTLELVQLLISGLEGYTIANRDGVIDLNDAVQLVGIMPKIVPALQGLGDIPGELAAMSEADRTTLIDTIKTALDLPDKEIEAFAEQVLTWLNATFDLVRTGRAVFTKKKA